MQTARPLPPRGENLECVERGSKSWGLKRDFEDVEAWVVGFKADNAYPSKFVYRACTVCNKSLEQGDACGHGTTLAKANIVYRFDVTLCDHTGPLLVTFFDAAQILLGKTASEIFYLDPQDQMQLVEARVHRYAKCLLNLRAWKGDIWVKSIRVLSFRNVRIPRSISPGGERPVTVTSSSRTFQLEEAEYNALMSVVRKLNFGESSKGSGPSN